MPRQDFPRRGCRCARRALGCLAASYCRRVGLPLRAAGGRGQPLHPARGLQPLDPAREAFLARAPVVMPDAATGWLLRVRRQDLPCQWPSFVSSANLGCLREQVLMDWSAAGAAGRTGARVRRHDNGRSAGDGIPCGGGLAGAARSPPAGSARGRQPASQTTHAASRQAVPSMPGESSTGRVRRRRGARGGGSPPRTICTPRRCGRAPGDSCPDFSWDVSNVGCAGRLTGERRKRPRSASPRGTTAGQE